MTKKKDRTLINCQNCKLWAFDMDMEPFCVHKNASSIGTDINAMRGAEQTRNMRGKPCGPKARFFQQEKKSPYASKELNA